MSITFLKKTFVSYQEQQGKLWSDNLEPILFLINFIDNPCIIVITIRRYYSTQKADQIWIFWEMNSFNLLYIKIIY